jgi:hypothetical protein
MLEFNSEPRAKVRIVPIISSLAILVVAAVLVFLIVRYQQRTQVSSGSGPIPVPGMQRPGDPNFEYYKGKIRIENAKAALGISFGKNRVAIISGIISNEGDRKLEALELHITLFDAWGKFSKDRTTTPVRPDLPPKKPMEPLEKRPFTVGVESVEQYWDPKKVEINITGLKYQ